jgi:multidrug resistance efflux pump
MSYFQSNPPSYLRYKPEPLRGKQWNWQQFIYILLLVFIVSLVIWYFVLRLMYSEGVGHVVIDQVEVKLKDDAILEEIIIAEGKKTKRGEHLFRYNLIYHDFPLKDTTQTVVESRRRETNDATAYGATVFALLQEKARLAARITENEQSLNSCKSKLDEALLKMQLGVITRPEYELNLQQCKTIEYSLGSFKSELKSLEVLIQQVPKHQEVTTRVETQKVEPQPSFTSVYRCPITGRLVRWNKKEQELILAGESIVTIQSLEAPYILAYFEQSDAENISIGKEVEVELSNNYRLTGQIDYIYPTTLPLPAEFNEIPNTMVKSVGVKIKPKENNHPILREMNNIQVNVKIDNKLFRF